MKQARNIIPHRINSKSSFPMTLRYEAYLHLPPDATERDHMYVRLWLVSRNNLFTFVPVRDGLPFYRLLFQSVAEYRNISHVIANDLRMKPFDLRIGHCFEIDSRI